MPEHIAVYGSGWQAAQAALTLADLGVEVDLLTPSPVLEADSAPAEDGFNYWPLLLRAAVHPRVHLHTNSIITQIGGLGRQFTIVYSRSPRFVKEELCTACGECAKVCSVKLDDHTAIRRPLTDAKSVPSTYLIEKDGISPCRGGCPLEINVHGYISLIRQGKIDKALDLINQKAPLAAVLGRLCTHPCETKCARQEVDKPLFIQALHRFAADNAGHKPLYALKTTFRRAEKVAIIGSGPAGLTAAWELARRGFSPTVFESHSTPGGMLAVGIPGFRLSAEIRQKDIAAIQAMGVEIKTGRAFGRDIGLDSLTTEGYQAVFLAVGAHSNNRLNIPGENLAGVVDCLSWLQNFNSHQGERLDERIVVIGGGNSAVDSARSARRLTKKDVRILCLTAKMTAVPEEVEEAVKEGIPIDYNNSALEILGQNGRVTGLSVIKVRNVQFDSEGRISLERIEGSEYVVPADKVIIAIGQRPDSAALNLKELRTARNQTIQADPLTLETNLYSVFAGGDAVTGSKNVVSAMAAGLRVAESIDRFLRGVRLKKDRTLDQLQTVEVDIAAKTAAPVRRVKMPALPAAQRQKGYAETSLGLTPDLAQKESSRCLDCAGCCECLECETVCEVKAVNHSDSALESELNVAGLLNLSNSEMLAEVNTHGLFSLRGLYGGDWEADSARVTALAFNAAVSLKLIPSERPVTETVVAAKPAVPSSPRISVFLCACGTSNSSILDFGLLAGQAARLPGVVKVRQIAESCTPEGASQIRAALIADGATQAVLAACRCCNWDQVCYSCGDRRVMCRQNLNSVLPAGSSLEYVNIREMCAWLYRDDPSGATINAAQLIAAGVKRAVAPSPAAPIALTKHALIISNGLSGLSAAAKLAAQGFGVTLLSNLDARKLKSRPRDYQTAASVLLRQMTRCGVEMLPWPDSLALNGAPGRYEASLKTGSKVKNVTAGCLVLDIAGSPAGQLQFLAENDLLARVIRRLHVDSQDPAHFNLRNYPYSIGDTAALLLIDPIGADSQVEQITAGEAAAARAMVILNRESWPPRGSAIHINRALCRGCGDCAAACPLISLKPVSEGLCFAEVDPALCLGCGLCVGVCPTGAIRQPAQNDEGIEAALEAIFIEDKAQ